MANVKFTLDAESAKAVGAFLRVVDAQKKSEDGFKKQKKAASQFDLAAKKVTGTIQNLATSFLAGGGVLAGLAGAVKLTEDWHRKMQSIGREVNSNVRQMASFILLQDVDNQKRLVAASKVGAPYGVGPVESAKIVGEMQSIKGGDYQAGVKGAASLMESKLAGMDVAAVFDFFKALDKKRDAQGAPRFKGWESKYILFRAGQQSDYDPAVLSAGLSQSVGNWRDPYLAATAAQVQIAPRGGQWGTFNRNLGVALNDPISMTGKVLKRLGAGGGTEMEKLEALALEVSRRRTAAACARYIARRSTAASSSASSSAARRSPASGISR